MTLITTVPALCALLGLLIALLTSRETVRHLAYIAFGCGLLVVMMQLAGHVIRL
jgi:Na+/phosphate symporter